MKQGRHRTVVSLLLFLVSILPLHGYKVLYAEQWYRLFHLHFYQYPERCAENIYYLEQALRADFANPLNALARIGNPTEWEYYRYLFSMHVSLKLVEQYLLWGSKYDKQVAYFYNAPWKEQNLESLDKAEALYRYALVYWEEARRWAEKAEPLSYLFLPEIQYWADERARIANGELDYRQIIGEHLARLQSVREAFLAMDEDTY
ncbi:hypothetical protein [Spirochaeta thermophila]|uniref:Uncharacterized protein n=1 Tax=Winmispira thermophila (strain ATCC 49972 / DSM 6192 / RI 19.B1) TaxID=665571 RepID=E0RST6_WINT6|nr:hypothetical protein [Spirochaeta thermophila]ADN02073.1 hypothetical protein STHERM_c11280 [Spirochaeta thermophila DSM 6192]